MNSITFRKLLKNIGENWIWVASVGAPIAVGFFINLFFETMDVVLAGNLGTQELAGVALGFSLVPIIFVLGMGFLVALNPISGQLLGAKRYSELSYSFFNGLLCGFLIGVVLFIFMRSAGWILLSLNRDPEIVVHADVYLTQLAWGMPALFMALGLRNVLEGLGVSRPYMLFMFLALLFKIPLAIWWVFGGLGLPAYGVAGAGFSTSVVNFLLFFCTFFYCVQSKHLKRLIGLQRFLWGGFKTIKELLLLGGPIGMTMLSEVALFALSALLISEFGTINLAAHQVAINFGALVFMIPLGLSVGLSACISQRIGQQALLSARFCGWSGIGLIVSIMSFIAVGLWFFAYEIADLYTDDAAVREIAAKLVRIAAVFQVFDGLQAGGMGALRGYKDTKFAMFVSFFIYTCGGLLCSTTLGFYFGLGVYGVWYGFIVALMVSSVFWLWRFKHISNRGLAIDRVGKVELAT